MDQLKCVAHDGFPGQCRWEQEDFEYEPGAVFEEYRYDALGRRVMVRSRPVPECSSSCTEHLDVQVWDGDQLAFEHRYPSASASMSTAKYQRVAYTHAGGIDQPVSLLYRSGTLGATTIVLHANRKGLLDHGTHPSGDTDTALRGLEWAGLQSAAYPKARMSRYPAPWRGSLIRNKQDASGQIYMRNRYYDPVSGQFTQTDPIGLAGGLNLYGFADGDPVNFSDPFGLCKDPANPECARWILLGTAVGARVGLVASGALAAGSGGAGLVATPVVLGGSTLAGYAAGRLLGSFDELDLGQSIGVEMGRAKNIILGLLGTLGSYVEQGAGQMIKDEEIIQQVEQEQKNQRKEEDKPKSDG